MHLCALARREREVLEGQLDSHLGWGRGRELKVPCSY